MADGDCGNDDGAVLRWTSWALSVLSICCFSVADLLVLDTSTAAPHGSNETRIILLVVGVLSFAWSGLVTSLSGMQRFGYAVFRFYQPFQGGLYFVALQAMGWTLYSVCCAFCVVLLLNFRFANIFFPGELSGIGALGFAADALLNFSLDSFNPQSERGAIESTIWFVPSRLRNSFKALLSFLVALLAFVILIVTDVFFKENVRAEVVVKYSMLTFVINAVGTYLLCGRLDLSSLGFRTFQPFKGGPEFTILQAIGWALLGTQLYVYMNNINFGMIEVMGGLSFFGACGFTSNAVLLLSLAFFTKATDSTQVVSSTTRWFGHSSWLYHLSWVAELCGFAVYTFSTREPFHRALIIACMVVTPPLAHVGGWVLLSDRGYRLFQPLNGGLAHVISQTFGWFFYGIMLFSLDISWLNKSNVEQEPLLGPLSGTSIILLLVSVTLFEPMGPKVKQPVKRRGSSTSKGISAFFVYGDLLCCIGFLFGVGVDVCCVFNVMVSIRTVLLQISIAMWLFSKVAMYRSIFNSPGSPSWKLLGGPDFFVMSEAISWTLFAISFLSNLIILNAYLLGHASLTVSSFGWSTAITLGHVFSHMMLRYGASSMLKSFFRDAVKKNVQERNVAATAGVRNRGTSISMLKDGLKAKWTFAVFIVGHISWLLFFVADFEKRENPDRAACAFFSAVGLAVLDVLLTQVYVGPRSIKGYKSFQPFRGGSKFVLLQAIGWSVFAIGCTLALVCANLRLENIALSGIVSLLGTGFYAAQMLLLWSLRYFENIPRRQIVIDSRVSLLMVCFSLLMFFFVDITVIRFGLPYNFVRPVVACAWVAGCSSVPLSAYVLFKTRSQPETSKLEGVHVNKKVLDSRTILFLENVQSPSMIILGCALWSFTFLLGALLVFNTAFNNEYIPVAWSATLTGISSVVSHVVLNLAMLSSSRDIFTLIPIALGTSALLSILAVGFTWVGLPLIRGFLDYPMHYYAMAQKRVSGWLSPDGLQALRNVHLDRHIRFGPGPTDFTDILRPYRSTDIHVSEKAQGERPGPVIYLHGGGHVAVSSEILLHSVTPLCRSGLTVYSVEYPLSPGAKYPVALLCALRAALWIRLNHCSNPDCKHTCRAVDHQAASHECTQQCFKKRRRESFSGDEKRRLCVHCGRELGVKKLQLLGDSAGGSLVTMLTALLCNRDLCERTIKMGGKEFQNLLRISFETFPKVERLCALYGLLGRQTPDLLGNTKREEGSRLWRLICAIGIKFIFKLYEKNEKGTSPQSTLTDLSPKDLKGYSPETLLICGKDDPLLPSNIAASRLLNSLCHKTELHILPGTHAFHGFPVNWMHYIGCDWKLNALPATILMLRFLTGNRLDEKSLAEKQESQALIPDYTPFFVFPLVFFFVPLISIFVFVSLGMSS
uniref:Alpha/beta hydrolase fold-3 domain-containing protein n=1 Tax=Mucochytrium quahogii TaxID=96639 RepID=A0A7S2SKE7_9STRA|mmetsp:Transcript_20404/g.33662  ORF Transcript_20404/g.33662 Transcript_20404/m.33662 type:complete len:1394 (-) Transcript_20404:1577-5758(-)|eukprot:CAMPEP_0203752352 /NCGR_PEP_ID=MMETSP0098-20131031/6279_1 /ASSEMBLY_ACC=CAM_ASM_000208 /TAXON_ID=96639 /ORGANISM=" , Strain NY0313808BC1" /LENGTH=1393 /DNA_ID=CAMNT_0050642461 /DNA_START=67 /DNA_END=4248 /DNA_ORIENTATION=+